ncbi:endonuclease V [Thalassoglobus polymorphus]|uniref:Endonuclease V n=1 Tax=Thalassoglobus polymorphus TaxID=2527994 RepID=A0A517QQ55_9PLAN|nr:endonuclease V [Thalassoglobus polymorphus]QDT33769.1 Endonuclease V [Thalassoglobus polymorphus]
MKRTFSESLCELPDLRSEVLKLLAQVPVGQVTTYGDLARALGDEKTASARWLGAFFKDHDHQHGCTCHRVVRSNGEIGMYVTGDPNEKAGLLKKDGVMLTGLGNVDLACRFSDFHSVKPLKQLKEFQFTLAKRRQRKSQELTPRTFAGVDCAYRDDGNAVGAYVELDSETLAVTFEESVVAPVEFPYIPGFLSFREMPVLLLLLDKVRRRRDLADIIFVDGNGILHPRRAGIATCLGVLINRPTLGIGKSLLCGSVDTKRMRAGDIRPVYDNGELIGNALKTKNQSKPIFASPGNLISLEEATLFAKATMTKHRTPEPIFYADRFTKQLRKN